MLVSIIVPIHNVSEYLRASLDSILSQTFDSSQIEVILIDDASTDDSRTIMHEYSTRHSNFRTIFLEQCSGSASVPRNVGLSVARGEYVMFLDPDDLYVPSACETMVAAARKHGSDVLAGSFIAFDDYGETTVLATESDLINVGISKMLTALATWPNVWSRIYKRAFIQSSGARFPAGIIGEDIVFNFELYTQSSRLSAINSVMYRYRNRVDPQNPSKLQKLDNRFFKEFSQSRRLLREIGKRNGFDYIRARYFEEIELIMDFIRKSTFLKTNEQRAEAFRDVQWIALEGKRYYETVCTAYCSRMTQLLIDGQFEEAAAQCQPLYEKSHREPVYRYSKDWNMRLRRIASMSLRRANGVLARRG